GSEDSWHDQSHSEARCPRQGTTTAVHKLDIEGVHATGHGMPSMSEPGCLLVLAAGTQHRRNKNVSEEEEKEKEEETVASTHPNPSRAAARLHPSTLRDRRRLWSAGRCALTSRAPGVVGCARAAAPEVGGDGTSPERTVTPGAACCGGWLDRCLSPDGTHRSIKRRAGSEPEVVDRIYSAGRGGGRRSGLQPQPNQRRRRRRPVTKGPVATATAAAAAAGGQSGSSGSWHPPALLAGVLLAAFVLLSPAGAGATITPSPAPFAISEALRAGTLGQHHNP
ncbi:unnamed protein product, partial [Ectocarpus sp. 12 AP-2014]